MKKYAILFLLLSSCAITENIPEIEINESFPHNEIQKIAVIMFETPVYEKKGTKLISKTSIAPDAGEILANMTARELAKWGKYVVVSRKALEEELELKNLREEDFLHTENYSSLGRSLGVDAIVVGEIEKCGFSYITLPAGRLFLTQTSVVSFKVKCIDVITNETIWTVNIKGSSKKDSERVLASELITKAIKTLKAKLN